VLYKYKVFFSKGKHFKKNKVFLKNTVLKSTVLKSTVLKKIKLIAKGEVNEGFP